MNHTPGPWRVEPAVPGEASGVHVFAANPNGCAADGDLVTIADFIENEANARLIAAAPDLLASLVWAERQLRALVTEDDGSGVFIRGGGIELAGFGAGVEKMRAAIAKAS